MTKIRNTIILLLFCAIELQITAQAVQLELHNKYWNYRNRYRQYFTHIGKEPGEGVPIVNLDLAASAGSIKIDTNGNDIPNADAAFRGILNYGGDNTVYLGYYLAMLSTEYFLLTNAPQVDQTAVQACKNELYFAINALDRVDRYAKGYFAGTGALENTADGFFVRDDAQPKNINFFQNREYPQTEWMGSITSQGREIIPSLSNYAQKKFVTEKTEGVNTFNVRLESNYSDDKTGFTGLLNENIF